VSKPTSKERKRLRAELQRILMSFWGNTERQVSMRTRPGWTPALRPLSRYVDRQSELVLADIARMRAWCDEVEEAYR
jgi:hypothetical protein